MLNAFKRFSLAFFYFAEPLKWLVITETEEACMPEKILLKSMLSLFFQQKRSAGLILFVKGGTNGFAGLFGSHSKLCTLKTSPVLFVNSRA